MTSRWVILTTILALVGLATPRGQDLPQPGPQHEKLGWYVGKWTSEAEMTPSPFGPGGKMSFTDTCEWFSGSFHVICRSEGTGPMGEMKGVGIIGYDPESKIYTYYAVDSAGHAEFNEGRLEGKTWTWTSEATIEGKKVGSRFTIVETSATSYTYAWESAADGEAFQVVMKGKATKVGG